MDKKIIYEVMFVELDEFGSFVGIGDNKIFDNLDDATEYYYKVGKDGTPVELTKIFLDDEDEWDYGEVLKDNYTN